MADLKPIEINYQEPDLSIPPEEAQLDAIFGGFPKVSTTPTWKPRSFREAFALKTGSATIYYYDFGPNVWRSVSPGSTSYAGIVDAGATAEIVPTGWSVGVSANIYTVSHNLGTTSYSVVVSPMADLTHFVIEDIVIGANTFTVRFTNTAGVSTTTKWHFVLVPIS
jgi:hypothetical protein